MKVDREKCKKIIIGSLLINTILLAPESFASEDQGFNNYEANKAVIEESYEDKQLVTYDKVEYLDDAKLEAISLENNEDKEEKTSAEKDNPKDEDADIEMEAVSHKEIDYKENIEKWVDSFAGNSYYDKDDEKMVELTKKMDKTVEGFLKLVDKNGKLWTDLAYDREKGSYKESKFITQSYRRLESLAKQFNNKGSVYYQKPEIKEIILKGLEWEYKNNYNENKKIDGNWWDYEIGTPRAINNTLSLLYKDLDQETINKYVKPINHFVPDPYQFRVTLGKPFKAKGGNLIDMGRVKIIAGFLQKDSKMVNDTIESLKQIYEIKDYNIGSKEEGVNNGFYIDGSYVDHDSIAYTGAYGNVMLDGFSQLLPAISKNTNFDSSQVESITKIIDKAFLPLMYRTQMMDMVRGRSISREKLQGHQAGAEVMRSILRIAEDINSEKAAEYNSFIKYITSNNDFYKLGDNLNNFRDISLYNKLKNVEPMKASKDNEIHVYNNMNKLVYRNNKKDYALGISMHSDKIKSFEYMNGENSKGWYTSDGATYLYNNDLSHYSKDYWATVDHSKLPSTTETKEERDSRTDKKYDTTESFQKSNFVGATKLNNDYATISMDFNNWNDKLRLKKSWFILGDKIAFLGSKLTKNNAEVYTTIENRKLSADNQYKVYINDKENNLSSSAKEKMSTVFMESKNINENIGYYFINDTELELSKDTRKGKWSDINKSEKKDERSNSFISLVQKHTNNEGYAYVMAPAVTKDEFNKMAADKIKLLSNDEKVQAVYSEKDKVWGLALYEDSEYKLNDDLILKDKGLYTISLKDDKYLISYYDPTNTKTELSKDSRWKLVKTPSHKTDNYIFEFNKKAEKSSENQGQGAYPWLNGSGTNKQADSSDMHIANKDIYEKLKKAYVRSIVASKSARFLLDNCPKTVKDVRNELVNLLKTSENLTNRAEIALRKMNPNFKGIK